MEKVKEKLKSVREGNKRSIIIAGLLWKVLATSVLIGKCNGHDKNFIPTENRDE